MKIHFTKAEYRVLIEMIYMADWLATAHDEGTDPNKAKYDALREKIYAHAKEMECEDCITTFGPEFTETQAFENGAVRELIDSYDEHTFWDQLVDRLTVRDLGLLHPGANEESEEYSSAFAPIENRYADEFEAHGLARVQIADHQASPKKLSIWKRLTS